MFTLVVNVEVAESRGAEYHLFLSESSESNCDIFGVPNDELFDIHDVILFVVLWNEITYQE